MRYFEKYALFISTGTAGPLRLKVDKFILNKFVKKGPKYFTDTYNTSLLKDFRTILRNVENSVGHESKNRFINSLEEMFK